MDRFSNWTINTGHCSYHEPSDPHSRVPIREMIEVAWRDGECHIAPHGPYLWSLVLGVSYALRDSDMPSVILDHSFSIMHAQISHTAPLMVCLVLRAELDRDEVRRMVRWLIRLAEKGITWLRTERSLDGLVEEILNTRPGLVTLLMGGPHVAFGMLARKDAVGLLSSFCTCVADALLTGEPVPYDTEHYMRLIESQTSQT